MISFRKIELFTERSRGIRELPANTTKRSEGKSLQAFLPTPARQLLQTYFSYELKKKILYFHFVCHLLTVASLNPKLG